MSITKITTLLMMIFLLFPACNARSLGVLNKNEEKPNVDRVSSTPTDVKAKPSLAEPNSSVEKEEKDHDNHRYGVSVTWKVHQQKREDPPPEFNLDYLPARTHPPVHN
ncbi:root meristem growth factor 10-like [Solanum dulcamara]|uniref:root meristem growth factor 10-like n=1 Tax=Solanum dulcamara TaxID=45834 RepID=UPI0024859C3C|nr:root meristem growth factor 10-like [Solanum dulcamara]